MKIMKSERASKKSPQKPMNPNLCTACKGEGYEEEWPSGKKGELDEFGNGVEWVACDQCSGTGLSRKLLGQLEQADEERRMRQDVEKRLGEIGILIESWKRAVADLLSRTDDEVSQGIGQGLLDEIEEAFQKFWGEPADPYED